ncbi:MAG: sensor histidine kinase, partial [Holophagales bacterium]|nr:sensor histidine kinase [Holophagales bacterium]
GIELRARFEADLPPVNADVGLMERALQNLLDNALRHTPSGGTVEVRLEERAGRVEVAVSDTGSGIAPEDLPRIFERFYRSRDKQVSRTGAGFGLAIAARIAELHGGRLDVESALGEGSTFRFDLEIAAPTRARITAPAGV